MIILTTVLLLILITPPPSAYSETLESSEIKVKVDEWLIKKKVSSNIKILPGKKYPKCSNLIINDISTNFSLIKVSCIEPNKWSFILRNKIEKTHIKKVKKKKKENLIQFVSLKKNYSKGKVIREEDLEVIEKKIINTRNLVMNKTDIIGKTTKRTIMSNKPIYENYLQKSWMIEKNEEITIENNIGSIYIKVDGIALQNADFMDKIKVMNKSSGQIFTAYVKNKKKVTLKPKQN